MANRRMISSDTWEDEFVGSLTFFERCLWIGLFSSCADDQGRLQDNPIVIRSRIFPYDDIQSVDIDAGLTKFQNGGKILRYVVDGKKYIQILKWWGNQKPQWAARSKYPSPEGWNDHIRTRENGQYYSENWGTSEEEPSYSPEQEASPSPEGTTFTPQMRGQYPVPVPVPVPIPVPVPVPVPNDVVVEECGDGAQTLGELAKVFIQKTHLKPGKNRDDWIKAEIVMAKAGVTPDDIATALNDLSQKGYKTPSGLPGMVKSAIMQAGTHRGHDEIADYTRYRKDPYFTVSHE